MKRPYRVPRPLTVTLFCAIALTGCGAKEAEVARPTRGEIRESFTEPARTRLANTYRITMPVDGRIARVTLEPGDAVTRGQALAKLDLLPLRQRVEELKGAVGELEARIVLNRFHKIEKTLLEETAKSIEATRLSLEAAKKQVEAEKARTDWASKELKRRKALLESGSIPQRDIDDMQLRAQTSAIELSRQEFYTAAFNVVYTAIQMGPRYIEQYLERKDLDLAILREQLAQAKARLARAEHDLALARVLSPIDGVVLERLEQGDRTLPAGQDLLLLGNRDELEVVADVLTQDAMRLRVGSPVALKPATRREPIDGTVKRIEPAGFTKLSSLGVEQQRVNVIVAFPSTGTELGVGYRLQAEFLTGSKADALLVPRFSVLQAPDRSFYVLKLVAGRLAKQPVTVGLRSDLLLEITEGLGESETIVSTPDTTMREGMKVRASE